MTRLPSLSRVNLSRRSVMLGASAAAATALAPVQTFALGTDDATALVNRAWADITRVMSSGKSGASLYRDFEAILARYADVPVIARSVLGADWRSATDAQRRGFTAAFQSYLARKYGSQFRNYRNTKINVTQAVPVNRYIEVRANAVSGGAAPAAVTFLVSDGSGSARFFDLRLQGVSLARTERGEIGAMLDKHRGNIDAVIADLNS